MNWNDPEARLHLLQTVGPDEYNRRNAEHLAKSVEQHVNGHVIRRVGSRFGQLFAVGDTGRAFLNINDAIGFAKSN